MAYASSVASAVQILDLALGAQGSSGAGITGGRSVYRYCSSHAATDIGAVAGFFTGCGAQPYSGSAVHPNLISRSANNVGMRPGDVVLNIESSDGASPGRVTLHGVTASTFAGSSASSTAHTHGYDCTVAAHAST